MEETDDGWMELDIGKIFIRSITYNFGHILISGHVFDRFCFEHRRTVFSKELRSLQPVSSNPLSLKYFWG
ncbi:hypothetical protein HanRHA438_Chr01g0045111 [Helianthus annuus]|nr:hypothetical protein HanRHA438_Chr01g0045111 [Helianthus annuus]